MDTEACIKQFQTDSRFRLEPRTLKSYHRNVKQFLAFTDTPIKEISKKDIRNWLNHLLEDDYKPGSVNSNLVSLKNFFKYCYEEGWIQENPVGNLPFLKLEETIPRYLTGEQLAQLRTFVEKKVMEQALIEVLYATGVRISELAAMKKRDINWSERSIIIPEGKRKKGRIVLFNKLCAEHLMTHLDSRTDDEPFVFVNALANKSIRIPWVNKKFQFYSKHLGFNVTPHTLRHTFAAHLARKGMPLEAIQMLLGHDSPHTTQIYAKLYDNARKEKYDELM